MYKLETLPFVVYIFDTAFHVHENLETIWKIHLFIYCQFNFVQLKMILHQILYMALSCF